MGKSKAVSSHRSPRKKDPQSHAEARRRGGLGIAQVPQLPKMFWGHEGVLECSGLTELGMGIERVEGEDPKRCPATAVQERRVRNLTRRRDGGADDGGRAWLGGGRSAAGGG
jgi:hypothetical protein